MELQGLINELRQDPEYVQAEKDLRFKIRLANAVLFARLAKGWSQTELARRVQTRQANISRIESSDSNPTLDLIRRICDALEIEMAFCGPNVPDADVAPVVKQNQPIHTSSTPWLGESYYRVSNHEHILSNEGGTF